VLLYVHIRRHGRRIGWSEVGLQKVQ
jgi:hypothetical protein